MSDPLTTEELAELRKLAQGGTETALEWRAAVLAAHPFLLDEVESLRASLSTAEKALAEKTFEHRPDQVLRRQVERAEKAETALEKALGALRAVLDTTCDDHADMCCVEWCGRCRDEAVARKAGYAILSGGAHIDGPKAPKEEMK